MTWNQQLLLHGFKKLLAEKTLEKKKLWYINMVDVLRQARIYTMVDPG